MERKKLYVVVQAKSLEGRTFHDLSTNPGIGGTEYLSLHLAEYLTHEKAFDVTIVSEQDFRLTSKQFSVIRSNTRAFLTSLNEGVVVVPYKLARDIPSRLNEKVRLVGWMHHPFIPTQTAEKLFAAIVTIGGFQHISNFTRLRAARLVSINNFVPVGSDTAKLVESRTAPKQLGEGATFVFMGALIEGKGFIDALRIWKEIYLWDPTVRLEVIGGANLYGVKKNHEKYFCSESMVKDIKELLYGVPQEAYAFHGTLGEERFDVVDRADYAIFNPFGKTEAFPGTLFEFVEHGVIPFSTKIGGNYDIGSFIHTLNNSSVIGIVESIKNVMTRTDAHWSDFLHERENLLKYYRLLNQVSMQRWEITLERISDGKDIINFQPSHHENTAHAKIFAGRLIAGLKKLGRYVVTR